ncbi:hypothetical protein HRbin14_01226 [bacterium HR14]|nr:hypothetical protein HRbin14_01226 [bacterium HR14]
MGQGALFGGIAPIFPIDLNALIKNRSVGIKNFLSQLAPSLNLVEAVVAYTGYGQLQIIQVAHAPPRNQKVEKRDWGIPGTDADIDNRELVTQKTVLHEIDEPHLHLADIHREVVGEPRKPVLLVLVSNFVAYGRAGIQDGHEYLRQFLKALLVFGNGENLADRFVSPSRVDLRAFAKQCQKLRLLHHR